MGFSGFCQAFCLGLRVIGPGLRVIGLVLVLIGQALTTAVGHANDGTENSYARQVRPFLEKYCIDCHAEGSSEADVVLDQMLDAEDAARAGETWV